MSKSKDTFIFLFTYLVCLFGWLVVFLFFCCWFFFSFLFFFFFVSFFSKLNVYQNSELLYHSLRINKQPEKKSEFTVIPAPLDRSTDNRAGWLLNYDLAYEGRPPRSMPACRTMFMAESTVGPSPSDQPTDIRVWWLLNYYLASGYRPARFLPTCRTKFIDKCLNHPKRGMPMQSKIFASVAHESRFVRCPYHKTALYPVGC